MGWRFRKSFSPLPGVRLTFSKKGISTSIGAGPLRLTVGPHGPAISARIPGTGLSYRHSLSPTASPVETVPQLPTGFQPETPLRIPQPEFDSGLEEVRSAGSGSLTTEGLQEFKKLIERSRKEKTDIARELETARREEETAVGEFTRWRNGWLYSRFFKKKYHERQLAADLASAKSMELAEQKNLCRLETLIEMPDGISKSFSRFCDDFSLMAKSQQVWDTVGQRTANRASERTTATRIIERKSVGFGLGRCESIESELQVPHLANANGGDLYLYPGFILYFVSTENFALVEYKDVKLDFNFTNFIEDEEVPTDSKVVGKTWAKANKDGSPDLRFKGNHEIPVARYGKFTLTSATGMNEEYMISNAERAEGFAKSWKTLQEAVEAGV